MATHKLKLLCFDGGGVRGLSSLYILKALMEEIDHKDPPRPCHWFDLIGGTSTGGLLAIMLGRLKLSVDECITIYGEMCRDVFQKKRSRIGMNMRVRARFDTPALEKAIRKCIEKARLPPDSLLYDPDNISAKVFVTATCCQTSKNTLFTSYVSRDRMSDLLYGPHAAQIWQCGRATSAAPSFFDEIAIGPNDETFRDGGTGANNPVKILWSEAKFLWPEGRLEDRLQCIVSIGTGEPGNTPFGNTILEIMSTLKKMATETEQTAQQFSRDHEDLVTNRQYFRFNVVHGLENIGLQEYEQRAPLAAATRDYLRDHAVELNVKAFAEQDRCTLVSEPLNTQAPHFSPTAQSNEDPPMPQIAKLTPSAQRYAFHVLDSSDRYYNNVPKSWWHRVTEPGMHVYEAIYEASKGPDGRITLENYVRHFPPRLQVEQVRRFWTLVAPEEARLQKGLALALTYMIHLRWCVGWTPPEEISARRLQILERWSEWVSCACQCGHLWNFANEQGLTRQNTQSKKQCLAVEYWAADPADRRKEKYRQAYSIDRRNLQLWNSRNFGL